MLAVNYQSLIESGVAQWNQWRKQHPHQLPDLRGINLTHSYLFEIDLMGSDLRGVDLRRACLIGANLSRANLSGANLRGAYLSEANLREADLSHANLIDTQMANVDLSQANLVGTCLDQVKHTLSQVSQAYPSHSSKTPDSLTEAKTLLPPTAVLPLSQAPRFGSPAQVAYKQAQTSVAQSKAHVSQPWSPEFVERCQRKLGDYYIGPMTTLILNDIITIQQPSTLHQFIALVAAHIPDPQDALTFKNRFSKSSFLQPPSNSTYTPKRSNQQPSSQQPSNQQPSNQQPSAQSKPEALLSASPQQVNKPQISKPQVSKPQTPHPHPSGLTKDCIDKCRQQLAAYYIAPMAQMLIEDVIALHPTNNRQFVQLVADHLPPEDAEQFSRQVFS